MEEPRILFPALQEMLARYDTGSWSDSAELQLGRPRRSESMVRGVEFLGEKVKIEGVAYLHGAPVPVKVQRVSSRPESGMVTTGMMDQLIANDLARRRFTQYDMTVSFSNGMYVCLIQPEDRANPERLGRCIETVIKTAQELRTIMYDTARRVVDDYIRK